MSWLCNGLAGMFGEQILCVNVGQILSTPTHKTLVLVLAHKGAILVLVSEVVWGTNLMCWCQANPAITNTQSFGVGVGTSLGDKSYVLVSNKSWRHQNTFGFLFMPLF